MKTLKPTKYIQKWHKNAGAIFVECDYTFGKSAPRINKSASLVGGYRQT